MSTHPVITRLAALHSEELSPAMAAEVMGRELKFVYSILEAGDLTAVKESARSGKKDRSGRGRRNQWRITRADILAYLIRHTTGDRTALLYAIKTALPRAHFLAALALSSKPKEERGDSSPPVGDAANIICIKTRKRRPHPDPYAGHPELFTA